MPPYRNYIYEYHAKITSGEIIAGKWIKKIYEIIINGLQKQEYFFNAKAANKAIRFIENFCHHSKGRNDLIKLELWQKAIVSVIFGIQDSNLLKVKIYFIPNKEQNQINILIAVFFKCSICRN